MRPARHDPAAVEDDELVGKGECREAVGDDDRRPVPHRLTETQPDLRLGRRVHGRRCVVQDQDPRVEQQRPCDRDPLALAARERDPTLADHRVVSLRQRGDEVVRLREPRGLLDLLLGGVRPAERDVLAHRVREEERILRRRSRSAAAGRPAWPRARRDRRWSPCRRRCRRTAGPGSRASSCRSPCGRSARLCGRARARGRCRGAPGARGRSRTRHARSEHARLRAEARLRPGGR